MRRRDGRPESGLVGRKVQRVLVGLGGAALVLAVGVVRPWEAHRRAVAEGEGVASGFEERELGAALPPKPGETQEPAVPASSPPPETTDVPAAPVPLRPPPPPPPAPAPTRAQDSAAGVLFREGFEDGALGQRGWYDNRAPLLVPTRPHTGRGALEFRFRRGDRIPVQGGAVRRLFTPTDVVVVSYWVRYGADWRGSGKPYHPHEFHVITTSDNEFIGPSATHLTTYIEHNWQQGIVPRLAITDALNIDQAAVNKDLSRSTERRAVAGCNGGAGKCYLGSGWRNELTWSAAAPAAGLEPGPGSQAEWHRVEAEFRLNTIRDGRGQRDGVARYWFDGRLLIDQADVLFRTAQQPQMKFNQFVIAPYIGDGSPYDQAFFVDDIIVSTRRVP